MYLHTHNIYIPGRQLPQRANEDVALDAIVVVVWCLYIMVWSLLNAIMWSLILIVWCLILIKWCLVWSLCTTRPTRPSGTVSSEKHAARRRSRSQTLSPSRIAT